MSNEIKLKEGTTNNEAINKVLTLKKDGSVDDAIATAYDDYLCLIGLDPAVNRTYQEARDGFIAPATHAFGEGAVKHMAKNKDIQELEVSIPMGHDKLRLLVERDKETSDGKGGRMVHHGYTTVGYTTKGAGGDKGEVKKVREHVKALGMKLLASE